MSNIFLHFAQDIDFIRQIEPAGRLKSWKSASIEPFPLLTKRKASVRIFRSLRLAEFCLPLCPVPQFVDALATIIQGLSS
jgi:hypothetical protein